eukprot:gnl/TRDRNA2_/TRDRNA2_111223_c1_seq1.p1 gnl/TRDRNA2_/TRDRNA2_111223_c1~~gnl/TRDRNA2_/TRDRNA2_111223_c1_seq1.p1  ORF type:complete len:440 (-),score=59.46 gnl/TRDRNA2_/TRDRNA2_111223_c1_seq1:104-1423(-)
MLVGGPLPSCLIRLLRNDSLMDVVGRSKVYHTLLDMLKFLSSDRSLAELLLMTDGESDKTPEQLLSPFLNQAKVFLANPNEVAAEVGQEHGSVEAVAIAMEMAEIETVQSNLAAVKALHSDVSRDDKCKTVHLNAEAEDKDAILKYEAEMGESRFGMTQLQSAGKWRHCFGKQVASGGVRHPSATSRLRKELASMVSGLPVYWSSSIFLRADEQRMDAMKALIIGPEGTPYENGCFCFDLYVPPEYPNTNPLVQLTSTFGGKVRFNPNLYADGKVCLSLLGTWDGPRWNPRESTLMQVLVSIQSLIFVPEPYFNEPGNESCRAAGRNKVSSPSEEYNRCIRLFTARVAMLEALLQPEPAFAAIIKRHFELKRRHVRRQVEDWLAPANAPPENPRVDLGSGPYGTERSSWRGRKAADTESTKDFEPARVLKRLVSELQSL